MKTLLDTALERNELDKYLGGYPGYQFVDQYGNAPTDMDRAFRPIYERLKTEDVLSEQVANALLSLSRDEERAWLAMYYVSDLLRLKGECGKEILSPSTLDALKTSILSHQESLQNNFQWEGGQWRNGLWGDVLRMNKNIQRRFEVNVLGL